MKPCCIQICKKKNRLPITGKTQYCFAPIDLKQHFKFIRYTNFVLFCFLIFNWLPPSHYIYTGSRSSSPIDFLSGAQIMPAFFLHWIFCTCWTPIPRKLCHQIFTWLVPCCLLSPSSNTTSSGKSLNKLNPNLIFSHPIQSSPSYKGLPI